MTTKLNEFIQRFVLFINSADKGLAYELVSPKAVFHVPGRPDPLHGPEGYLEIIATMRNSFPDIQWKVEETIIEGGRFAVRYSMCGTHLAPFFGVAATGKTIAVTAINFYELHEGKIIKEHGLPDLFGLMQQIGALQ